MGFLERFGRMFGAGKSRKPAGNVSGSGGSDQSQRRRGDGSDSTATDMMLLNTIADTVADSGKASRITFDSNSSGLSSDGGSSSDGGGGGGGGGD